MIKTFTLAVLIALLAGCVSTRTTLLNPSAKRPPVSPDQVVIYMSPDKVPGKYEELAVLSSQGDYSFADDAEFYESFRKEAAKIGANGVIVSEIHDPSTGQKVGSAILGAFLIPTTMANRKTQATAIYVTTPADEARRTQSEAIAAERPARLEQIDSIVLVGMTMDEVIDLLGKPVNVTSAVKGGGVEAITTYTSPSGKTFDITFYRARVTDVKKR